MHSTNYSDAFKYLIYRPDWVELADKKAPQSNIEPGVY